METIYCALWPKQSRVEIFNGAKFSRYFENLSNGDFCYYVFKATHDTASKKGFYSVLDFREKLQESTFEQTTFDKEPIERPTKDCSINEQHFDLMRSRIEQIRGSK